MNPFEVSQAGWKKSLPKFILWKKCGSNRSCRNTSVECRDNMLSPGKAIFSRRPIIVIGDQTLNSRQLFKDAMDVLQHY